MTLSRLQHHNHEDWPVHETERKRLRRASRRVTGALREGESVALPGLGTISVKATAACTGVRPGTNQQIPIPAGRKVSFNVSAPLKDAL